MQRSTLEERYLVFKKADVAELAPAAQAQLQRLANATNYVRELRGAEPLKTVVVESDWPEYKFVVNCILNRSNGGAYLSPMGIYLLGAAASLCVGLVLGRLA